MLFPKERSLYSFMSYNHMHGLFNPHPLTHTHMLLKLKMLSCCKHLPWRLSRGIQARFSAHCSAFGSWLWDQLGRVATVKGKESLKRALFNSATEQSCKDLSLCGWCCGLNGKCSLQAHVFVHLVPSWWCCLGRLANTSLGGGATLKVVECWK